MQDASLFFVVVKRLRRMVFTLQVAIRRMVELISLTFGVDFSIRGMDVHRLGDSLKLISDLKRWGCTGTYATSKRSMGWLIF